MWAEKIVFNGRKATSLVAHKKAGPESKTYNFKFEKLILAAGAVQTPHLLRTSRCSKKAGQKLEFHMNLKIAAEFDGPVHAEKGTIFTVQIQEFMKEGFLFMASNFRPGYLTTTLSHFNKKTIKSALERYSHYAVYTAMIKPKSNARIFSGFNEQPLVYYKFDPYDLRIIKDALKKSAKILFSSGARRLYMPISGTKPVSTHGELESILENLRKKDLEILTVHAMASCPMSGMKDEGIVNQDGRLTGFDNVFITDASVLPTNIGESPQGTIMAFSSEITSRLMI